MGQSGWWTDLDSVHLLSVQLTDWLVVVVDLHHTMSQHLHQPITDKTNIRSSLDIYQRNREGGREREGERGREREEREGEREREREVAYRSILEPLSLVKTTSTWTIGHTHTHRGRETYEPKL